MTAKIDPRRRGRRRIVGPNRGWQGFALILAPVLVANSDARPVPEPSGSTRERRDYESDKEKKMIKKAIRAGIERDRINQQARSESSQDALKAGSSSGPEQSSSRDKIEELTSSRDIEEHVNDEDDSQLRKIQEEWYQGHVLTPVNADSHSGFGAVVSADGKGKQKATERISNIPSASRQRYNHARGEILRFNSQRSPFHSSQVGPLASKQPATVSVGIFHANYPFVPSGRRKIRQADTQARSGETGSHSTSDLRAEKEPYEVVYSVSEDVANGNVFKKGWTKWMLDDDLRLAVPDEYRRPRRESAVMIAKNLLGKKWYRWQPGQGYVLSRYKDYGVYQKGPGIALGQLLPPRERVYTSPLPLIPNDSKRDFIWLIVVWIVILSMIALFREVRSHIQKIRRGRHGQLVDGAPLVPSIRIFDDGASPIRTSSMDQISIGLRTRQRTQARNFRDLCKSAFFPESMGVNGKKRSSFSLPDGNSLSMTNLGWSKDTEGKVGLPFVSPSEEGREPIGSALGGVAIRRSKSSGPSAMSGDASQEEIDERRIFDEIKNAAASNSSVASSSNHHHRQTNDREDFSAGGVYSTGSNCHLYSNGMTSTSEAIYGANEGGNGPGFAPMKMHATISH
ncbi:uncharacterized protein FA14DRAFT_155353 [Meira miltonrushii]|uniref:Uncharacterized protein n=1 Tax=Meira miltonrushii TaxID=1280837 RepID=A0A316VEJ0_9BASI|nr:uncharacterized protein FA14DRAFT_155353 [Meira miltonrushii]PWN35940.1 hypothetical protein FA14DRAFT_155353 [Meira miltonrushii]